MTLLALPVVAEFVDGFQNGHGVGKFGGARGEDGDHAVFVLHAPRRNQGEGLLNRSQVAVRPAKGAVVFEAQREDRNQPARWSAS